MRLFQLKVSASEHCIFMAMRYAVIPTHNRPVDLQETINSVQDQVDYIIVIDNASTPPVEFTTEGAAALIIRDQEQPPNLSRLWNLGIAMANHLEGRGLDDDEEFNNFWIAILNDDVIVPPGWMDSMVDALDAMCASVACTDPHAVSGPRRLYAAGDQYHPIELMNRMVGWAFVLDGGDGIMADEDLRWWYGDTAIDVLARKKYGTVIVPGPAVLNRYANASTTGILAEQAGRDRATFIAKYGPLAW